MQLLRETQRRIVADNLAWHVNLADGKLIELGMFDSSTALWEVMKQRLGVREISFKWQYRKFVLENPILCFLSQRISGAPLQRTSRAEHA